MRAIFRSTAIAILALACAAPAAADDADRSAVEQRNLAFVLDFWNSAFLAHDVARFPKFFAANYVDHNPNITTAGLPGLLEYVHRLSARAEALPRPLAAAPSSVPPHSDVVRTMVDGELVTLIRKRTLPDPQDPSKTYDAYGFEMLRVHDGKIVEHWDSVLRPAPSALASAH